jgi:hypothetical protein
LGPIYDGLKWGKSTNTRNPAGIFPAKNRNRQFGWENSPTKFGHVPADFSRFFPGFMFFLTKRFTIGLYGPWCRSVQDFPVPFSTLAPLKGRLKGQEQVRAEAEEEWWSQEKGASDGVRCERHQLKLLLLFIELE